jgi:chitinase
MSYDIKTSLGKGGLSVYGCKPRVSQRTAFKIARDYFEMGGLKMSSRRKLLIGLLVLLTIVGIGSHKFFKASAATSLPAHVLTGYWQNWTSSLTANLTISEVPTAYDLIVVSFAASTATPGEITFNVNVNNYSEAQFITDIKTVQARGQHVIVAIGGENGTVSVTDSTSASKFATSTYALMQKYGFEGIDIDLEHGINSTYLAQALRELSNLAGPDLIITMAPQTLDMQSTNTEYFKLALAIKDILTIVNLQFYNSGSMLGYDGQVYFQASKDFLTALATIMLENGLRPDQVALGLPATSSAAGGGYVNPSIVNEALDCLALGANAGSFTPPRTYPEIRGAMTWSINWDASNNYNFANTVKPHLYTLPGGSTTATGVTSTTTITTATVTPTVTVPISSSPATSSPTPSSSSSGAAWAANTSYKIGTVVTYQGSYYQCIQAHTSLSGWEPANVPALWQSVASGTTTTNPSSSAGSDSSSSSGSTTWTANTSYKVGAVVTYRGKSYKCLQAHSSLTGWEPVYTPALWQAI